MGKDTFEMKDVLGHERMSKQLGLEEVTVDNFKAKAAKFKQWAILNNKIINHTVNHTKSIILKKIDTETGG